MAVVMNVYQFVSVWVELTDTGATLHSQLLTAHALFLFCIKVLSGKEKVNY